MNDGPSYWVTEQQLAVIEENCLQETVEEVEAYRQILEQIRRQLIIK